MDRQGAIPLREMLDARQIFETLVALGSAASVVAGWFLWVWPRVKRAWQNRTSVVIRAGIADLRAQGETAAAERSAQSRTLTELKRDFVLLGATMRAVVASDQTMATFEAGADGLLKDANRTYLLWTGRTFGELERWGWINCVSPQDRQRVRAEWESAVRDVRQSVMRFSLIAADGTLFEVRATATPIPEGIIPCEKFVGVIHRLDLDK
jgi:hypothetical protein